MPLTREDIFKDETLGLVDKRLMMKAYQSLISCDSGDSTSLKGHLEEKLRLSEEFSAFILHVMCSFESETEISSASVSDGVKRFSSFIESVGRYGPSPLLVTNHGTSDIVQAFVR